MPTLRDRFQRWPRPWRIAVVVLAVLYALYLLAGNIFLNTPRFDDATNRQPHTFTMQTGPALTVFPGQVMAWNVCMRGQADRTVYVLSADRAHARVALLPLFRREVRLPWLHATGLSAEVETSDTPIPPPPRGDQGWTLRLDAIASKSIRSARLGKLLIAGQGHGSVGFLKQLKGGPSELFPSKRVSAMRWSATTVCRCSMARRWMRNFSFRGTPAMRRRACASSASLTRACS